MNLIFPKLGLYGHSAMGRGIYFFLGVFLYSFCKVGMVNDKELNNRVSVNMILWIGNAKLIR